MRQAKAADVWRRLKEKTFSTKLSKIKFDNVPGLGSGEINFNGPITAICGGNGAGKSTLLSFIFSVLSDKPLSLPGQQLRFLDNFSVTEIDAYYNDQNFKDVDAFSKKLHSGERQQIEWIDCSGHASAITQIIHRDPNFIDLLETIEPREMTDNELKVISWCIGKEYSSCKIYEIEGYSDQATFPFHTVICDGEQYSSQEMGKGELALFLFHWRLSTCARGSIILLEEPESHLPVRAQQAMINFLADTVLRKDLWIILSSHSPTVLSKIPKGHLRLLSKVQGEFSINHDPSIRILNNMFGTPEGMKGIILVEDSTAASFTSELLDTLSPHLASRLDIVNGTSSGNIILLLKKFPKEGMRSLILLGLLDGDQRDTNPSEIGGWSIYFLPGNSSPESLLRALGPDDISFISQFLHCNRQDLHSILGDISGLDDHEWLENLAHILGKHKDIVTRALVQCWLDKEDNKPFAKELVNNLEKAFNY